MKKNSLRSSLGFERKNTNASKSRSLRLESLENREMLSATTWDAPVDVYSANNALVSNAETDETIEVSMPTIDSVTAAPVALGSNRVEIVWSRIDDATKYTVQMQSSSDGETYSSWSTMKTIAQPDDDSTTVSTQFTQRAGYYYKYRVCATLAEGKTDYTETADATYAVRPSKPSINNVTVDALAGKAEIEFTRIENAASYKIEYKTDADSSWRLARTIVAGEGEDSSKVYVDPETDPVYATFSLSGSAKYSFRVTAINACGASDPSAASEWVDIMSDELIEWAEVDFPTPGARKAEISWQRMDGAEKYLVQSCSSTDGETYSAWSSMKFVADPGEGDAVSTLFSPRINTYYKFRVRAYTVDGLTDYTETSGSVIGSKPENAVFISASADINTATGTLEFSTVDNASYYKVDVLTVDEDGVESGWIADATYYVGEGSDTETVKYIAADATSVTFTVAMEGNVQYTYRVRAYNGFGASASAELSETIFCEIPAAPEYITATLADATTRSATLEWNYVKGASKYVVEYQVSEDGETFGEWTFLRNAAQPSEEKDVVTTSYGLPTKNLYNFRVAAFTAFGQTDYTETTEPFGGSAPAAPVNFQVTGFTAEDKFYGQVGLSWEDLDNEAGYVVKYSTDGGETWGLARSVGADTTETSFRIVNDKIYQFKVYGTNAFGAGEASELTTALLLGNVDNTSYKPGTKVTFFGLTPDKEEIRNNKAFKWQYASSKDAAEDEWVDIEGATTKSYVATEEDYAAGRWLRVVAYGTGDYAMAVPAYAYSGPVVENLVAPTDFVVADYDSATGVQTFTWTDNAEGETGYVVEYSVDGSSLWRTAAIVAQEDATSATYKVASERPYQFRVAAYGSTGYSDWTYSEIVAPVGAPEEVLVTVADTTATITWDAVDSAIGYTVEQTTDAGATWTVIADTDSVSFDSALEYGLSYQYRVSAYRVADLNGQATESEAVGLTETPATISVAVENGAANVTWDAVAGATAYVLEVSANDGEFTVVETTAATSVSYDLTAGVSYVFRVKSYMYESLPSDYVVADAVGIVDAPTNLTVTVDSTTATVGWTASTGAAAYVVEASVDGEDFAVVATQADTTLTYELTHGSTYVFRVSAYLYEDLPSDYVVSEEVTTDITPADVESVAVSADLTAETATLEWTAAQNADGYNVEVSVNGSDYVALTSVDAQTTSLTLPLSMIEYGASYQFRVSAFSDNVGAAAESNVVGLAATPTNVVTAADNLAATVTWDAADGAAGYLVSVSVDGADAVQIADTTELSLDYTLARGSSYVFSVQSYLFSDLPSLATQSNEIVGSFTPSAVGAVDYSLADTGVTFSWTASEGADGYTFQLVNAADEAVYETTTSDLSITLALSEFTYGVAYHASVVAYADGASDAVDSAVLGLVEAPQNATAVADDLDVTVSWDAVTGAAGYIVEVSEDGGQYAQIADTDATSVSFQMERGILYTFRVSAYLVSDIPSDYAYTDSIGQLLPETPTGLTLTYNEAASTVTATWDQSEAGVTYTVERQTDGGAWTAVDATAAIDVASVYKYRVIGTNEFGSSDYSAEEGFAVLTVTIDNFANGYLYDPTVAESYYTTITASDIGPLTGSDVVVTWQYRDGSGNWIDINNAGLSYTVTASDVAAGRWIRIAVTGGEGYTQSVAAYGVSGPVLSNYGTVEHLVKSGSTLTWTYNGSASEGYVIQHQEQYSGSPEWKDWTTVGYTTSSSSKSFTVTTTEGVGNRYRVIAVGTDGYSDWGYSEIYKGDIDLAILDEVFDTFTADDFDF